MKKNTAYVLVFALMGAVLISGCMGSSQNEEKISVTGVVAKAYNFGGTAESTYYDVDVRVLNEGSSPITIDKVVGIFAASGDTNFATMVTPGETYQVLEPDGVMHYPFMTMGRTYLLQKAVREYGGNAAFAAVIYSGEKKLGAYGAPLPPIENLTTAATPLEFRKLGQTNS